MLRLESRAGWHSLTGRLGLGASLTSRARTAFAPSGPPLDLVPTARRRCPGGLERCGPLTPARRARGQGAEESSRRKGPERGPASVTGTQRRGPSTRTGEAGAAAGTRRAGGAAGPRKVRPGRFGLGGSRSRYPCRSGTPLLVRSRS